MVGRGKYEVSEAQQFIDRTGKLVRVTKDKPYNPKPIGTAYAFFDCNAPLQKIQEEISTIRNLVGTPGDLEIQLGEAVSFQGGSQISALAKEANDAGIKYAIQAALPNATNEQTADEVVGILYQAYHSQLYQKGEQFRGEVFYKEGGEYISHD